MDINEFRQMAEGYSCFERNLTNTTDIVFVFETNVRELVEVFVYDMIDGKFQLVNMFSKSVNNYIELLRQIQFNAFSQPENGSIKVYPGKKLMYLQYPALLH